MAILADWERWTARFQGDEPYHRQSQQYPNQVTLVRELLWGLEEEKH